MPGAESVPPRGLPFAARSGCTSSPCIGPPPACQHTNTQRTRRREHSRSGRSPSWRQTGSVIVAIVARPQVHLSKRLHVSGHITHRSCPRCQDAPLAPFCAPRALPPLPPRQYGLPPPPLLFLAALLSTLIAGAWPRVLLPSSRGVTLHELPFSTFVCANDATSWTHASYNQREEEVAVGHPISLLRISL